MLFQDSGHLDEIRPMEPFPHPVLGGRGREGGWAMSRPMGQSKGGLGSQAVGWCDECRSS